MFRNFGALEIGLILVIVVLVFGAGKLPQVGEALGKSIRGFKKSMHGDDEEKAGVKPEVKITPSSDNKPVKS
jgi:sec-independent protein translocase protein TatA